MFILDPRVKAQLGGQRPLLGLPDLRGKVIGVLDNGLMNSTPFMREIAALLSERYGQVIMKTKPSQSRGAPRAMLEEFATKCHVVITGVGD